MPLEIVLPDAHNDKYPLSVNDIAKYEWYKYIFDNNEEGIGILATTSYSNSVLICINNDGDVDTFNPECNWVVEGFKFMGKSLPNGTKISFVIDEE